VIRRDPLANPKPLIRRVYAYAAYRLGDGPAAEDVTSEVFERALRYRDRFDPRRGEPVAWLLGIARRCVAEALAAPAALAVEPPDKADPRSLEADAVRRLDLRAAVRTLDERDQELLALRYGADLTARQIAAIAGARTNAIEVALHRALARLRLELDAQTAPATALPPALHPVRI
jgi:RNA polymerase sigma-70 factor, ECF subfamily